MYIITYLTIYKLHIIVTVTNESEEVMKIRNSTILITGGGSGIGLGLAEELRKLDNHIIVAGRSKEKLRHAESMGMKTYEVDMSNHASILSLAKKVTHDFPKLNVVVQNAGMMKSETFQVGNNSTIQDETIATNLLGPMRLTDALLPHLLTQDAATIMTVTSGLAFLPLAFCPTYSATKAALHSYTQSLRYQLKNTSVDVIELVPPYVQTSLTGEHQASDPNAMPLKDYIAEVMQILVDNPKTSEILVKRVMALRLSAESGRENQDAFFEKFNDAMSLALGSN